MRLHSTGHCMAIVVGSNTLWACGHGATPAMNRKSTITTSSLPMRTRYIWTAATLLGLLGLALSAYYLLTSGGDASHSKALLAVSAGLCAAATLLYGVGRPRGKVSIVAAGAFVLAALTFLVPGEFGGWTRLVTSALLLACFIAWLRWVLFPKPPKTHVSKNRAQRRHPFSD